MNQLPINLEASAKYVKHVQKLDTNVFLDCHTLERTWRIRRGLIFERNLVYIHHAPECKWDIRRIGVEKGKIVAERLLP